MNTLTPTTGEVEIDVPSAGKPCKTFYKVYGDLTPSSRPLVLLHGGPGVCHNYLLPIADLTAQYNIPTIFYDQLGCGRSTHLPEKMGDGAFWTEALFMVELTNLLSHLGVTAYDLLGHSWGGMLGARFAATQPRGLRRLIISCSPATMPGWVEAADVLRAQLPAEVQATLVRCEKEGRTESKEYERAVDVYYRKHLCRVDPYPKELEESFEDMKRDPTVQLTMNGPSEFFVTGTLKHWTVVADLPKIKAPTLLINGHYDEAQDMCIEPYREQIPDCKWVKFANSSHTPLWEERKEYMTVVGDWLTKT